MKKTLTWMVILLVTTFAACRKNDQSADLSSTPSDPQLYKALLSAGIPENQIEEQGPYYVVFGELVFRKGNTNPEQVKAYFDRAKKGAHEEQLHTNLVNTNIVESIRVWVHPDLMNTWDYPARLAMQDWANIPNCKINFTYLRPGESSSLADVQVLPDGGTLPTSTIAWAEFPNATGNTGWRILVNTDVYTTSPGNGIPQQDRPSNMRYNMVHELGHTIGFLHTNASSGIQIPGTPGSGGDGASVMNGGTAANLWNGFSTYDVIAAQYLYPYNELDNWITSIQEDFDANDLGPLTSYSGFDINWNASLLNTPTVTLELYQNRSYLGTIASTISNNGHFYFTESHFNTFFPTADQSGVQVRIISDTNEWQTDLSAMFYINWE